MTCSYNSTFMCISWKQRLNNQMFLFDILIMNVIQTLVCIHASAHVFELWLVFSLCMSFSISVVLKTVWPHISTKTSNQHLSLSDYHGLLILLQVLSPWPSWRLHKKSQIIRFVFLCNCYCYQLFDDNICHVNTGRKYWNHPTKSTVDNCLEMLKELCSHWNSGMTQVFSFSNRRM